MNYKIHVCFPPCGQSNDRSASFAFLNDRGESVSRFFVVNGVVASETVSDDLRPNTVAVMRRAALHKFTELENSVVV